MFFLFLIVLLALGSSFLSAITLSGSTIEYIINGGFILGDIPIRIDALSGWMILVINITILTGFFYGKKYLEHYKLDSHKIYFHYSNYVLLHISMLMVCVIQNFYIFLAFWELVTISTFLLVTLESWKTVTIKAGINYLLQSHIGVLFLSIAFIWIMSSTGSNDFKSIEIFSSQNSSAYSISLFVLLLIGFGFKAGFVPLHTWLPLAHPAAPSHISGVMSGVIIKLGIFGILRSILLIKGNHLIIGEIILTVSVFSGLYGVMLAIVQHNLKRLLAYHSIENIGIIGIGIGIGTIGIGLENNFLAFVGFAGALLHILNHSLFKSLLFYGAGSVYYEVGTMDIDHLGGLIKRMPQTAFMFLIAALAISGLPPFNGFISEYLIYSGLFSALGINNFSFSLFIVLVVIGLVLIGGLALFCFTKAFGIVFLGTPRSNYPTTLKEVPSAMLIPQYFITFLIVIIGLFPQYFMKLLLTPVKLFVPSLSNEVSSIYLSQFDVLTNIGIVGLFIVLLTSSIYYLRYRVQKNKIIAESPTWSCGYTSPSYKMQYTASSFAKTYSNLIKPILIVHKKEEHNEIFFPAKGEYKSDFYDKIEYFLIDKNLKMIRKFLYQFNFLQNGRIPVYVSYGLLFILLIIVISYSEYLSKMILSFY